MYTYKPERCKVPIKVWSKEGSIESGALEQIENIASLPFVFKHVVLCPDGHQGYGMPIGGVLATNGVVIPNAVGVDIGCGVHATKTSLTDIDTDTLKKIVGEIRKKIPMGYNHRKEKNSHLLPIQDNSFNHLNYPVCCSESDSAAHQLGTLGGGNHFIEIQKGSDGHIWFMIHSGSRNLGLKVCNHYDNLAKKLNALYYSSVDSKWDLAFLPDVSYERSQYLSEMNYCLEFAKINRSLMADDIFYIMAAITGMDCHREMYDVHHNYAQMENHFGENVMVHRKGATRARFEEIGIIPGSQGTKSYIVKGKGCADSFKSCSHGAGRRMSRTKAQAELNLAEQVEQMDRLGIIHGIRTNKDLDEAPGAYKDIDEVMENQKDLVEIMVELKPLAVIKE